MLSHIPLNFLAVCASALTACAPTPRATTNSPPITAKAALNAVPISWHPRRQATSLRYMLQDSSILSISSDTTSKQVPFITSALVRLVISTAGDSFVFNGYADSVLVHSELRKTVSTDSVFRIYGTVSRQGAIAHVESSQSSLCKIGIEPTAARIADLLVKVPANLSIDSRWTDSSTMVICHGRTALRQTSIRSYHLTADTTWGMHTALRVDGSTTLTISGVEADTTNHVSAVGSGSTTSILFLDANSGALLQSSSRGTVSLTISTSRGVFPFRQDSFTQIQRQ